MTRDQRLAFPWFNMVLDYIRPDWPRRPPLGRRPAERHQACYSWTKHFLELVKPEHWQDPMVLNILRVVRRVALLHGFGPFVDGVQRLPPPRRNARALRIS